MNTVFAYSHDLYIETCCNCGINFAMPIYFQEMCRRNGPSKLFYCPNGHSQSYRETEASILKKQLEQKERELSWAREGRDMAQKRATKAEHQTRAVKGHLTRVKTRVFNGACPCCKRHFKNLQNHMASKHPRYREEQE